jgi:hypothetical protein
MTIDTQRLMLQALVESKFKTGTTANELKDELRLMQISDDLIDEAISEYVNNFKMKNSDQTLVGNPEPQEPWFLGPDESINSHWKKLCGILKADKGWHDEMIESLNESSNSVISKLANPNYDKKLHVKGLVLGYVQSGKTANYSAVITKALDSGYKFIIVLAGIHNNLRYQTEVRLRQEIVGPSDMKADPITRMDKNGDFDGKTAQAANRTLGSKEGFGIAVLKKNATVLRKFNAWLSEAREEILSDCKVLIIDDESDQASINTKKNPELDSTAINKQIKEILNKFRIASYVGYTATPFANILIDSTIEEDLFPRDFIVSLKKPVAYIGAEEIFGSTDSEGDYKEGYPLVKSINSLDNIENFIDEDEDVSELSDSMKYAIDTFIVAGAIRISRNISKHISMLFHCSHLNSEQAELHELVEEYLRTKKAAFRMNRAEELEAYKELHKKDFQLITNQLRKELDILSDNDWSSNIKLFLEKCHVILDNSKSDTRLSFESDFWGIVVGGNTLSRGLTIEGLTVSYFVRSSKMYDSLMQMGRWFGYRPGYLDLKRIFITDDLRSQFINLATVENEIRDEIKVMVENGDTPLDFRIRVRQESGMTVTARNKMGTAVSIDNNLSHSLIQTRYISTDERTCLKNIEAVGSLIKKVNTIGINNKFGLFENFRKSPLYLGVPTEVINQFLDEFSISQGNSRANKKIIQNYINSNVNLKNFNVAIVSQIGGSDTFRLPDGNEVFVLNRSYSPIMKSEDDPSAIRLRSLSVPRDEVVDLGELIQDCPKNADDVSHFNGFKGYGDIRRKIRKDGLLLIYIINNNSVLKEGTLEGPEIAPVKTKHVLIGLTFVFPTDKTRGQGKYVGNKTV